MSNSQIPPANDFVPYQEALALKTLGFNFPCLCWYNVEGDLLADLTIWYKQDYTDMYKQEDMDDGQCSAPTRSQAFRWFREAHNLHSNVSSWRSADNLSFYHEFEIYGLKSCHSPGDEFPTYEAAELACLKHLIRSLNSQ